MQCFHLNSFTHYFSRDNIFFIISPSMHKKLTEHNIHFLFQWKPYSYKACLTIPDSYFFSHFNFSQSFPLNIQFKLCYIFVTCLLVKIFKETSHTSWKKTEYILGGGCQFKMNKMVSGGNVKPFFLPIYLFVSYSVKKCLLSIYTKMVLVQEAERKLGNINTQQNLLLQRWRKHQNIACSPPGAQEKALNSHITIAFTIKKFCSLSRFVSQCSTASLTRKLLNYKGPSKDQTDFRKSHGKLLKISLHIIFQNIYKSTIQCYPIVFIEKTYRSSLIID